MYLQKSLSAFSLVLARKATSDPQGWKEGTHPIVAYLSKYQALSQLSTTGPGKRPEIYQSQLKPVPESLVRTQKSKFDDPLVPAFTNPVLGRSWQLTCILPVPDIPAGKRSVCCTSEISSIYRNPVYRARYCSVTTRKGKC